LSELQPLDLQWSSSARRRLRCVDPGPYVFTVEQAHLVLTAAFDAIAASYPIGPESRFDAVDFSSSNTLEDAYTDTVSFETICQICQIRGNEVIDDAGTHELAHHIRSTTTPDELALGSFTRRKLKQLPIWDLWLASEWKQLDAHQKQEVFGVPCPAHLVPRCCVPIGITTISRVGLVKLLCAVMDPSEMLQSAAYLKRMPRASTSYAYVCSLLCLLQ
jgi:hypothetical protein